ncbi:MAG: hypothetical protein ACM3SR_12050 [Ignavibacteriales bacterium]
MWNEIKNWILNPVILEEIILEKLKEFEKEKGNSFKRYSKIRNSIEKKKEEKTRILELYRRGTITIEDAEKQLKAIESEEKALLQMGKEIKSKVMIEDLPREELLKSLREESDSYSGKIEDGSISFEDKRRIIERFVKEVRVNVNGRKADRPSLVETIPFRIDAEPISSKDASIVTIYFRDKNTNDERMLQEAINSVNFADVIYKFPFPPKELGVIVNGVL